MHYDDSSASQPRSNSRPLAVISNIRTSGLAMLLAVAGCEGGEQGDVSDAEAFDGGASGHDAGSWSAPKTYQVSGQIVDLDERTVAGAQICIASHDEIPCAVSGPTGDYRMDLPVWNPTQPIAVQVSATGYLGSTLLLAWSPGLMPPPLEAFSALWFPKIPLTDNARAAKSLSEDAGYRFPAPNRAFVEVDIRAQAGSSVSATLVAQGAEELSPVYSVYNAGWESRYDPALTTTTNGRALFAEVPPGRFEVLLTGCVPTPELATGAWNGSKPNAVAGIAVAGSLTPLTVLCRQTEQL